MNVISINVRGLNNSSKRKTIYHWLNENKFQIICLQETFFTNESLADIETNWNGTSYHCTSNSKHSRGVSILISKDFEHNVISLHTSDDGRKLLINIEHNGQNYSVVSIYAPNEVNHRKDFFVQTKRWITDRASNDSCMLICGDFNCSVGDTDRKHSYNDRSRPTFRDFMSGLDVNDSFRSLNSTKISYTYSNSSGTIQSRLDYILSSPYFTNLAKKCYHINVPRVPDHKAVVLKLRDDVDIGPGYWKLNVQLLDDDNYIMHIKETIVNVKTDYELFLNKRQLWDICKVRIREESIIWSSKKAKERKISHNNIGKEINDLDDVISKCKDKDELANLVNKRSALVSEQNAIHTSAAEGAQIRARAKWIEQGEKNTKHFLNLENKRQTNNRIACIRTSSGNNVYKSN